MRPSISAIFLEVDLVFGFLVLDFVSALEFGNLGFLGWDLGEKFWVWFGSKLELGQLFGGRFGDFCGFVFG